MAALDLLSDDVLTETRLRMLKKRHAAAFYAYYYDGRDAGEVWRKKQSA